MRLSLFVLLSTILFFLSHIEKIEASDKVKNLRRTVFCAGDENINSYRIPSIVTAKNGAILVFCEARKESWVDKSRTDIVVKRSNDNGQTWSVMQNLTQGDIGAYMDPTPMMDVSTGRLFLFCTFWPSDNHSGTANRATLITSDDHGQTWSQPQDVTSTLLPQGRTILGFGPGSGLQMQGGRYKGRLILPARVGYVNGRAHNVAYYSEDHGKTWTMGEDADNGDEFQIAESPSGILISNARVPNARMVSRSLDGGRTWDKSTKDPFLPGVSKGCQASVLGKGNRLWFSGIQGIEETTDWDERARLTIYKSLDGGRTWNHGTVLNDGASGYCCMTFLPDGKIAIIFETADTQAFTRKSIPDISPLKRPSGWMRLDFIVL